MGNSTLCTATNGVIEKHPYLFGKLEFVFCLSAGNDEGWRLQPKAPSDEGAVSEAD